MNFKLRKYIILGPVWIMEERTREEEGKEEKKKRGRVLPLFLICYLENRREEEGRGDKIKNKKPKNVLLSLPLAHAARPPT